MKLIHNIGRYLLGIIFLIFGLNGLYTFIPVPDFHPFIYIMVESGFILVIKLLEISGGLLLISSSYTFLALLILGPIVVNILLYHVFIDPRNWIAGLVNFILYSLLLFGYRSKLKVFFQKNPGNDFNKSPLPAKRET